MKLMTYNICDGGSRGIDLVIDTIKKNIPDLLVINEANTFSDQAVINKVSQETNLPYFHLALSGEYDYHVAIFSKVPFIKVEEIHPLMRAGILVVIETEMGEMAIVGTHLTPYSEDLRLDEIKLILEKLARYENKILLGDMNSLSKDDEYDKSIVDGFNQSQLDKFTTDGELRFDVIEMITKDGFVDCAVLLNKNRETSVPTLSNVDVSHSPLRLDYIFASESFKEKIKSYQVFKDDIAERASDHYPVIVVI